MARAIKTHNNHYQSNFGAGNRVDLIAVEFVVLFAGITPFGTDRISGTGVGIDVTRLVFVVLGLVEWLYALNIGLF